MIISVLKERWFYYAFWGKLQEMRDIHQELTRRGFPQEVKNWKVKGWESTALFKAATNGHLDVCQWLVREDLVDVNAKDVGGLNALHIAAMESRTEIVGLLLEETSIDVNEQNDSGSTALHFAARYNGIEVAKLLLKHNAVLLKDKDEETALDEARTRENDQIIELLKTHYNI